MRSPHALLLLLALVLPACASHGPASDAAPARDAAPTSGATVSVDNRSASDMDIYVQRRDGPVRIGFVPAKDSARFALAPGLITGSGIVQFSARPTRGGESAASDAFTVQPGDEIAWVIPQ